MFTQKQVSKQFDFLVKDSVKIGRGAYSEFHGHYLTFMLSEFSDDVNFSLSADATFPARNLSHTIVLSERPPFISLHHASFSIDFWNIDEYQEFCDFFAIDADSSLIEQFHQAAAAKA